MTSVKVECDCGQRYAFDVEPVHGRMPAPVACPTCGADGTAKANAILAQMPVAVSRAITPLAVSLAIAAPAAVAVAAPAVRLAAGPPLAAPIPVAAAPRAMPPPLPPSLPPPVAVPGAVNEGVCAECGGVFPIQNLIKYGTATVCTSCKPAFLRKLALRQKGGQSGRGKDGWNGPETGLHKAGQYVAFVPALLCALVAWHFLSIPILIFILAAVVAVFGIIGGIINVWGRGPVWAGACVGLITSLCGFFAVSLWIHFRQGDAWWIEVIIAFVVGCMPGILVQYLLQKLIRKVSGAA